MKYTVKEHEVKNQGHYDATSTVASVPVSYAMSLAKDQDCAIIISGRKKA
jgi:predicted urease superfamily metal-dependent hydrolase